jgi:hypothetical protein
MTEPGQQPATIIVPAGNYNAVSWATMIGPLLTVASTTNTVYAASFSTQNGKLTVTSTPASATSFTFANSLGEGIHDQMGQLAGYTVVMAAGSLVSSTVCSYVAQDAICIKSDICTTPDGILQDLNGATIPFGASITWESADIRLNAKKFAGKKGFYNFYLQDVDGHDLNTNGRPWSLTICIFRDFDTINLEALRVLGPKLDHFLDTQNSKTK